MSCSEPAPESSRIIIHVDMDAFYCSVEERDNPSLKGRPVVVGGTPEGRGVVATANYAAREFGIHSAMPAARAVGLCPGAVFLRPRPKRYSAASREVFSIFEMYTPLVEPLSIDEAFLDLTGSMFAGMTANPGEDGYGAGVEIAAELQERIEKETGGLTCSIGVASNKYLAKIASDLRKPRGITIVPLGAHEEFLAPLSIEKIWGVGPKMAQRLRAIGLDVIGDMQRLGVQPLRQALGQEQGEHFWRLCRGIDHRPVVTEQEVKSISQEKTYGEFLDSKDRETVERELFRMSDKVAVRLRARELWGRTVHLKARDEKFHTVTRSTALDSPTCLVEEIYETALGMYNDRVDFGQLRVRLLGVGVSGLTGEPRRQLDFFDSGRLAQAENIAAISDAVRRKIGDEAIVRAKMLDGGNEKRPRDSG